ncbi:MAG TPA: MBL fold metallo-hydrolase [Chondromyces sp.]|nr:MBL fold metallo-hydrolase [Chondromyces sp.]
MQGEQNLEYGKDYKFIPDTSVASGIGIEVLPDVYNLTIQLVNLCFIENRDEREVILVDTGMPGSADEIIQAVEKRFGPDSRPKAIVLTHGHFDHVGAIIELIQQWDIPVYAHELELPYLTGKSSYLEPDSTIEGGLIAKMSPLFPNEPINLGGYVRALPANGEIPGMSEWKWIHTPGHAPGHVSLFREKERILIAGDAFVTVKQESLYKVLTQAQEISGPPRYLTTDWQAAWESVKTLQKLNPSVAITGHGLPMSGPVLRDNLEKLVQEFDTIAIPDYGQYVNKNKH